MAEKVFINYRRDDAAAEATLVTGAVRDVIGSDAVFMDSSSIEFGAAWPERIQSALKASRFVLVLIGPDWLRAGINEWGQRRIDDESDWVRQEIATALLENSKIVIPLLVRGGHIPPSDVLPTDVCGITSKQAIELRRDYWAHDIQLLINRICTELTPSSTNDSRDGVIGTNPLLSPIWDQLAPNLQDAFVLAANAAQREGKDIISTRTLFAALRRLHPKPLSDFFDQIPSDALPEPISEAVPTQPNALAEIRFFSSCVQDSLDNLTPQTDRDEKLTAQDMFVDIARHGRGSSVKRLRTHGVDTRRINDIVRQLGWSVAERA